MRSVMRAMRSVVRSSGTAGMIERAAFEVI
jgi:hypothetical protein